MTKVLEEEKILSPYFFVKEEFSGKEQFPLKSTEAVVNISGVIADVKLTQTYKNEGYQTIEAIYVFPASTMAALHAMKMKVGTRTIVAEIRERKQASEEYEEAKISGKTASLLEQQRPNVFQMNVANILPGEEIKVDLQYTELLVPADGVYEFVYPAVVGPRYSNQLEADVQPSDRWVKNPYLPEGELPNNTFDITVNLSTAIPLQEMMSPSHKVNINYEGAACSNVRLAESEKFGGNRDFILKYRLIGGRIDSGVLLYEGEKEKFFLLMTQPPERSKINRILPREYIFIVDVSGSMYGFPMDTAKVLMENLLKDLTPDDTFNILLFSFASGLMADESLPATNENIRDGLALIREQHGSGGTELLPALQRALSLPRKDDGVSRTIVVITDGFVNIEAEAFDLIRQHMGDANLFAFGIGSDVNRHLIEGMARVGMGEPFIIIGEGYVQEKVHKFRRYIQSPVLTKITVEYNGFDAFDAEPSNPPDMFAERPIIVCGKWKGMPSGEITISGLTPDKPYKQTVDLSGIEPLDTNKALRFLWARNKIAMLGDYNSLCERDNYVKEITDLGLAYNLLTPYTSFIAVDFESRKASKDIQTVIQPLPLPEDVSNFSVGCLAGSGMGMIKSVPRFLKKSFCCLDLSDIQPNDHRNVSNEGLDLDVPTFLRKSDISFLNEEEDLSKDIPVFLRKRVSEKRKEGLSPSYEQLERIKQKAEEKVGSGVDITGLDASDKSQIGIIETALRDCLEDIALHVSALIKKKVHLAGEVDIKCIIGNRQSIDRVDILHSSLKNSDMQAYICKRIKKLRFPSLQAYDKVVVSFTLVFSVSG
ncbi:VWA domain-containing protein [bacterium]|nr:VWA domain-containing protein [bacterium]